MVVCLTEVPFLTGIRVTGLEATTWHPLWDMRTSGKRFHVPNTEAIPKLLLRIPKLLLRPLLPGNSEEVILTTSGTSGRSQSRRIAHLVIQFACLRRSGTWWLASFWR